MDENASVIDVYIPKPFRAFAFVTFSSAAVAKKMIKFVFLLFKQYLLKLWSKILIFFHSFLRVICWQI